MKQNLYLFLFVLLIAVAGFFVYFQQNLTQSMNHINNGEISTVTTSIPETALENPQTVKVKVYFNNSTLNPNSEDCSLVFPVERQISMNGDPIDATLKLLFMGPTEQEKQAGYTSLFSPDTKNILKNVKIDTNGVAYVDFVDIRSLIPDASTSCGSAQFLSSIDATLKQFGIINKIIYAINGDSQYFYEWLQIGCSEENNNCDPTPFQEFYVDTSEEVPIE